MAQKSEGVTIGYLGTGTMDIDNATDLIEELIEALIASDNDPVRFVFPLTTGEFTETLGELVEMAKTSDISYEIITHSGDKGRRTFNDIASSASKTYHVADVFTQMEQILVEAPCAVLEVLWDGERETEMSEILGRFLDAGIDVRDLTDGNAPIAADETTEAEEEPLPVVTEEGEIVEEGAEEAEEAEVVYARSDLEGMRRPEVREIAVSLGLAPRKSTAAMIDAIMEAQGGFVEEGEEAEEPEEPEMTIEVISEEMSLTTGTLTEAINRFPGHLHDVLDQFLTDLAKTIEGLVFNATPEEPAEELSVTPTTTRRLRAR